MSPDIPTEITRFALIRVDRNIKYTDLSACPSVSQTTRERSRLPHVTWFLGTCMKLKSTSALKFLHTSASTHSLLGTSSRAAPNCTFLTATNPHQPTRTEQSTDRQPSITRPHSHALNFMMNRAQGSVAASPSGPPSLDPQEESIGVINIPTLNSILETLQESLSESDTVMAKWIRENYLDSLVVSDEYEPIDSNEDLAKLYWAYERARTLSNDTRPEWWPFFTEDRKPMSRATVRIKAKLGRFAVTGAAMGASMSSNQARPTDGGALARGAAAFMGGTYSNALFFPASGINT